MTKLLVLLGAGLAGCAFAQFTGSVQGRVLVQAIIDTTGGAEPSSVMIIQSPNPGFDQPAKNYVLRALFRPGRVHGRAVRVLLNLPIDFKIRR